MSIIKTIRTALLLTGALVSFASFGAVLGGGRMVFADEVKPLEGFCNEVGADKEVCANSASDPGGKSLLEKDGIVDRVFRLISWLTGMLAVVFIFVGGFKLAVSGGDKDSVKSARNMIIYAMVGLTVILLSNLIFNLIIGLVKGTSST